MLPEQHQTIISCLQAAVASILPEANPAILLERPKVAAHGDIATNVAMQLAKPAKRNPRELAQQIVDALMANPRATALIAAAELAGPGFINFRLTHAARIAVLTAISEQGATFGRTPRNGQKVLVEFVSANPTGPLHVGHARQAALGDALCRLFDASGFDVSREFYYNDAGNQIHNLALSVQARGTGLSPEDEAYPAEGYKGDYIVDIAKDFLAQATVSASDGEPVLASGDLADLDNVRRFAVAYLRREQDFDLQAFGLAFDHYYLESSLYTSGRVEQTVQKLVASGHTYESEGALWLRTTELGTGDDKDRVMRKSEGGYTYFVPDIAYHVTKWQRGYTRAINIQGSDHHGTVARVRAGLQALALGIPADYPAYILHKMVKVMRGGVEVKISKRAGSYVTLQDLIEWVGRDAVRKAQRQAEAVLERVNGMLRQTNLGPFRTSRIEVLGSEASYGAHARALDTREVIYKLAVEHDDAIGLKPFLREFDSPTTSMSVGTAGWFGSRAEVRPVMRVWSTTIALDDVPLTISLSDCCTRGSDVWASASSAWPRTAVRMLLKSCAMPPASTPRLSSFCVS